MTKFIYIFLKINLIQIILAKSDNCLYDEITLNLDPNTCIRCDSIIKNCLNCDYYKSSIICIECKSGYQSVISNGIIDRCLDPCPSSSYNTEFRDILLEDITDSCSFNKWASKQIDFVSYDMINTKPRPASTSEINALISFFNNLNGNFWIRNDNWLEGDPCINKWFGVGCNLRGNVISLFFKQNSLNGIIEEDIQDLIYLRYLHIFNNFNENLNENANFLYSIPSNITLLTNLKELVIKNVNLQQTIDKKFFDFGSSLEILDFSFNSLTSFFDINDRKLNGIIRLNLSNNKFYGTIENLKKLPSTLEFIQLHNNFFNGTIPVFYNLPNLVLLDLRNNKFVDVLSYEYFKSFPKLEYIGLMLNNVQVPEFCKNSAFCVPKLISNLRNTNDVDFKLSDDDLKYLYPR